jgi:Icc-related predicted phosphoesterase
MKIQIGSDFHTEFWKGNTSRFPTIVGDILVLAGDICTFQSLAMLVAWLETVKVPVIYVLGNHEYYHADIEAQFYNVSNAMLHLDHVHILENHSVEVFGTTFIGSTLWTNLSPNDELIIKRSMADMNVISGLTPNEWNRLHHKAYGYIKLALWNTRGKDRVVVTHHSPSYKSCAPRWKGDGLNAGFHNSMEELIMDESPNLWIHGHTHDSMDYMIRDTRIICNPMGYPNENKNRTPGGYEPEKVFEI